MKATEERLGFWLQHVEAFERGDLRRKEYCQGNGITLHRLDYWRRRLRQTDPTTSQSPKSWIPLNVTDDSILESESGLRLRMGRLSIDVRPGFDRELLTDVLRVVGSVC